MDNAKNFKLESDGFLLWFISHERYFYFLILLILILILTSLFFLFQTKNQERFVCGDGAHYNSCSAIKPYYCGKGILVENVSICGCPKEMIKENDTCFSKYDTNPKNLVLKYTLNGKENEINFTVYAGIVKYLSKIPRSIEYKNKTPSRTDFKLKMINEKIQRLSLLPLVVKIRNRAKNKEDQMRIAVSIVQNLKWGYSNKTIRFAGMNVSYARYPYEVLYDSMGLCGEKSELLAFLLKELGYNTIIFYNQKENHESVGIKCPLEHSWDNSGYCFIETSGPAIISDTSIIYVGGIKITSKPQILNISQGGSALGEGLREYKDAKRLMKIRKKVLDSGRINFFDKWELEKLDKRYGLAKEYNLK